MYEVAHLGLIVKDCEQSADFYCRLLGCKVAERLFNEQLKIIALQTGSSIIEIIEYSLSPQHSRGDGVYDHLAFYVGDIQLAINSLKSNGVKFETDSPRLTSNGKKIIFFIGPDGERIELVENNSKL